MKYKGDQNETLWEAHLIHQQILKLKKKQQIMAACCKIYFIWNKLSNLHLLMI